MNKVTIKNESGEEVEVVATAARVWIERGWTLVEDENKPEAAEPTAEPGVPPTPSPVEQAKAPRATAGSAEPDAAKKE